MANDTAVDSKSKKIGTHNGTFHCDEVLATCMLKMLKEYKDAQIIRSRDKDVLATCDVVVDVGGVYDHKTFRYDHHQSGFYHTLHSLCPKKKWKIKLSSAGLVYHHYGHEILAGIINSSPDDPDIDVLFDKIYENFIVEIDAIDNGINQTEGETRYSISTNLSNRVSYLNPHWNEESVDAFVRFEAAMDLVRSEFIENVTYFHTAWLPARDIVMNTASQRYQVDESGEIACLERFCPWKDHLFHMEEEGLVSPPTIKFMLYCDEHKLWRVQCVPEGRNTFSNRLSLHYTWRGLRDEELCKETNVEGCTFVHSTGFIGGNSTYEGALEMARQTLILAQELE